MLCAGAAPASAAAPRRIVAHVRDFGRVVEGLPDLLCLAAPSDQCQVGAAHFFFFAGTLFLVGLCRTTCRCTPGDPPCDHRGERNRKTSTQCFTDWFTQVDGDRAALAGGVGSQPSLHQRHNLGAFQPYPGDLCHDAQTDRSNGRPKTQHGALPNDILHTLKVLHMGRRPPWRQCD